MRVTNILPIAVVVTIPAARKLHGDCSEDGLIWDCSKNGLVWTAGALRMNHLQVIGTHNSYHIEAPKAERDIQSAVAPSAVNLQYSHAALDVQLDFLHVRNIELRCFSNLPLAIAIRVAAYTGACRLDLLADPKGGAYAEPIIRRLAGLGPRDDPSLKGTGTKVLHIPDIDYHTVCSTLVSCLQMIKKWLDAHPDSVPLPIMMEFKTAEKLGERLGGARVVPWDQGLLDLVDYEIRSVFRAEQLITPDDVRRGALTLERSVLKYGWPDLDSARGRIFFLMDNGPVHDVRDAYRHGRPNLEGRAMFTNSAPGEADCAFQKLNEPSGYDAVANIQQQVRAGYWVRTRSDVPLDDVLKNRCSTTMRDAALRSGAHVVSTDFPAYEMSARWGCDYAVRLPGGKAARCNPVNGPESCDGSELEPPEYTEN